MQNMTTKEDDQMEVDDGGAQEECCPICYTEYRTTSDGITRGSEYARIVCSGRCQTFSMVSLALSIIYTTSLFFFSLLISRVIFHLTQCRLCVYRQSTYLSNPFVVDDTTGDFTTLDPTKCPQW